MPTSLLTLWLMATLPLIAGSPPGDWTGDYRPCHGHTEVLKRNFVDLGVRFSTTNRILAAQFARAMDYWAAILDMDWHEDDSSGCSIQVVDGHPGLFAPGVTARAQFPGTPSFQGWIAFNPRASLTSSELFLTAVHELGHVLGLPHSANSSSVMYFLLLDGPAVLDDADLAVLATRHQLRAPAGPAQASRSAATVRNPRKSCCSTSLRQNCLLCAPGAPVTK